MVDIGGPAPFTARVEKDYRFSAEQVFDAWLDPAMVAFWFTPQLGEMVRVDIDAREGGIFRLDQQRGEETARHWGTYQTIDRPRRLAFTWYAGDDAAAQALTDDGSSLVTIDFTPTPTGCSVVLAHTMDPQWSEYEEQVRWGWTTMLNGIQHGLNHEEAPGTRTASDTVRFQRHLPASPETVWAWLTESGKRALWLGSGELPAREGESPSEVTFELAPDGDGTLLTITHILLDRRIIANVAGGWHTHLAILADRLAGVEPRPFWGLFTPVERAYEQQFSTE